jgi:hypothetical protein
MRAPPTGRHPESQPVRIGELGANFEACGAAGTTRNLKAGEALPVRSRRSTMRRRPAASPQARASSSARAASTRNGSESSSTKAARSPKRCGVSEPVTRRRDYDGPCRSGWVQSAFVKVIAGDGPSATPAAANVSEAVNSAPAGA